MIKFVGFVYPDATVGIINKLVIRNVIHHLYIVEG